MIIKSHIRGGYRAAAQYLKDVGKNEKTRLVGISDIDANNLDEAFNHMWVIAHGSKVKKPLHHVSINPFKDEHLTDKQVLKIIKRCEEKYGYKPGDHQRVIVEHIKDGRQHFHVIWNRVSMTTGKAVWPGHHWKKSKQAAREMELELGLKRVVARRVKRQRLKFDLKTNGFAIGLRTAKANQIKRMPIGLATHAWPVALKRELDKHKHRRRFIIKGKKYKPDLYIPVPQVRNRQEMDQAEHIRWAFENGRLDVLAMYGIHLTLDD